METPKLELTESFLCPLSVGETFNTYAEAELRIHQWGEQNHTLFIKTDGKRVNLGYFNFSNNFVDAQATRKANLNALKCEFWSKNTCI